MHARFYHPEEIVVGKIIELSAENKHHAARVLRLKNGDPITLFNGLGGEFSAHIEALKKSSATVMIDAYHDIDRESLLSIELAQAICVNEKMDWIIQKSVELGITRIQPVFTARCIVHLSDERSSRRLQHWKKIIISACEQCGRNHLPQILPLISLWDWLNQKKAIRSAHDLHFMLSTKATEGLKNTPKPPATANIALAIGPEGGFTPEEETAILHSEFIPLRLGKRILRTESAALATVAAMQVLWGDY
ncbi:16S rRNA (uracil(1498)-N(3))-methyltransferase [uncultured Nitrosomonas sp.]|uniref:16S rRNA (uracil(1498)-N(3))-methyltransferase n=1 Tax=uncultured Nitrosomonas sp. TaxID=156424 RepID=UPI0025D3B56A|nr:16S rRNA (uracil(1498)-N(3))-methyltransferase [uncultured Nitrosomonas sp.]